MLDRKQRVLAACAFAIASLTYLGYSHPEQAKAESVGGWSGATELARSRSSIESEPALWVFPVSSHSILRDFLAPNGDYSAGHRGVDLPAIEGETVTAVAAGTIRFAGSVANRGVVSIALPDSLVAEVEPICPSVSTGDLVVAGQTIGTVCGVQSRSNLSGQNPLAGLTHPQDPTAEADPTAASDPAALAFSSHCAIGCLHLSARRFDSGLARGFEYLSPRLFLGDFAPSRLIAVGSLN